MLDEKGMEYVAGGIVVAREVGYGTEELGVYW